MPRLFSARIHIPPRAPQGGEDLEGLQERQTQERNVSLQRCSQECSPRCSPKEHNQSVQAPSAFIHRQRHPWHFISQHLLLNPSLCTPGSSSQGEPEGFLSISTPSLPGQRTALTPNRFQDRYCRVPAVPLGERTRPGVR